MKKILLGIGTLATIAMPVTMVVSCGDKSPLYTKNKDVIISNKILENVMSEKGFTKIDLEDNPNQIKNLESRTSFSKEKVDGIQEKVENIKKEAQDLQENLQKGGSSDEDKKDSIQQEIQDLQKVIQSNQYGNYQLNGDQFGNDVLNNNQQSQSNINILSDLKKLKYDKDLNNAYYKDTITTKNIQIPHSIDFYSYSNNVNYNMETFDFHKISYIITDKKTNEILSYPIVDDPNVSDSLSLSDFDSKLEDLSFNKIERINKLRKLIQDPNGMSKGEDGKEEKNSNQVNDIIRNILFHTMNAIPADGAPDELDWMNPDDLKRLDKVKNEAKDDEEIVYITDRWNGNDEINKDNFLRLRWLPSKFQFDESIYHIDKKDDSDIDNNMLDRIQIINNGIRNWFENRADFDKKVNEMFFKKFMSDAKLNDLISKFKLKKIDKDSNKIYSLKERIDLQHKWKHKNIIEINTGTSGGHDDDYTDVYYSIVSSHGISSETDFYVSNDGSNEIDIKGGQATSPEEDAKGFKKAFDHGIVAATLNDISALINLRRDHSDDDLYNHIIDSIMGIDTSFDPDMLDAKTLDGNDNPQKIAYDKLEKSLGHGERVVAFKKGENEYQFIKIKSRQDGLKLDLDIYKDNEFDQKVKANKLNNILVSEFADKEGFFKKLDSIFY